MIKVALDTSPLVSGHKSRGIGFYTKNLLAAMEKNSTIQVREFEKIDQLEDADIIHYPYFDLFQQTLPFRKKLPTVVTIHDVIPLEFPQHYPSGVRGSMNNFLQKISLKNVAAVLTDSKFSQQEIIKYLGVPKEKVFPVYLAPAAHFHQIKDQNVLKNTQQEFQLPEKFALFSGGANYNKNLLNLTEATLKAGLDLVVVGKSFETRENLNHPELSTFAEFLKKYVDNPLVHMLGFVEDADLVAIMNLATVLLLPSFAEGFGLTILEAQICGTPVITSNISSMPEVAGEGAILVDPYSVANISKAIEEIVTDKTVAEDLRKKGFENVSKFSWEKTTEETIQVYEKVISSRI